MQNEIRIYQINHTKVPTTMSILWQFLWISLYLTLYFRYSSSSVTTPKGPPCVSLLSSPTPSNGTIKSRQAPVPTEVHRVTLFKDNVYEDFGFSVSDGLYDKGIYVARVRSGGPADNAVSLLKVNRLLILKLFWGVIYKTMLTCSCT